MYFLLNLFQVYFKLVSFKFVFASSLIFLSYLKLVSTKQLQQQVHKLIDEVEQHRQQLEEEVEQQIMDSSDKPQSSNISNIQLPPLSDSSYENAFETPAHFASENFASAHQNNQASNAPIRTVPTSQMSEEIVESREEAHWSTKMEFASESNKATIKEAGNPFTLEETQASQSHYITDSSHLFYSNGTGQQEYQQQSYTEGGYYYGNETANTPASMFASTAEGYASNYQDYSYAPSTYETPGYYSTDYGANNPYGAVPPASSDIYQYNYNYDGQYAAVSDQPIEQQIPVAVPYSGLNPFSEDGNALPYKSDLPPQTNETPVDVSVYGSPPRAPPLPPPPVIAAGLGLPGLAQKTRTHDPFSWEAQESEIEQHGGAPLPPRTSEDTVQQKEDETSKRTEPPARPKIPPPSRPPAPTTTKISDNPPSNSSPSVVKREPENNEEETEIKEGKQEDEEDPWARFNKMTEMVNKAVKNTGERLGQLGEQSAASQLQDDQQVQSYLSTVGGTTMQLTALQRQQILEQEAHHKKLKAEKRQKKLEKLEKGFGSKIGGVLAAGINAGKEVASVAKGKEKKRKEKKIEEKYDPKMEEDMEKAATELAKKIAAQHGFKLGNEEEENGSKVKEEDEESDESEVEQHEAEKVEAETNPEAEANSEAEAKLEAEAPPSKNWAAAFESASLLPPSESDVHLAEVLTSGITDPFDTSRAKNLALGGGGGEREVDPFAPLSRQDRQKSVIDDPFDVRPIEELIAEARQQAEMERARREAAAEAGEYIEENEGGIRRPTSSRLSTPTQEGGSPVTPSMVRPVGFEDDFKNMAIDEQTPLYDEDDSQPLSEFPPRFTGDGWELLLRYPPKKKLMADRYWKPIFVRLNGNMLSLYANAQETRPSQEILLQANYSLSDPTLQAYDIYGKIHTVKLQHILYRERVGIRPGQISRLVEGHITKYGLPLEHAAQCNVIAKFGSLDASTVLSFTRAVEDALFVCPSKREFTAANAPLYRQDEVQIHCYDEYEARIDREGFVHDQKARVRLFCLAFLTGTTPTLEIGLNDRRREGKEIVRRKDILPMYTERWIRFEAPEFHSTVEKSVWEEDQVVRLVPPDGCFFELMRFRVRPPKNREKPLSVKCIMRLSGKQVEIRIETAAALHQQCAKGTVESTRSIPCENICIRFPIPEAWIYIFREERHWGVGSVHSKMRKPGKVKNLKDKLMGTVQQNEPCLIEVGTGEAKYEHLFRSLVWRISRLPDKQSAAYKSYMLKCRFTLTSFDLMPETFMPQSELEFTMPLAIVSNTVARSVGVEQHEDSDRVEKFVRYLAKFHYRIDNDYIQCPDLDVEDVVVEQPQQSTDDKNEEDEAVVNEPYGGYRIELPDDNIHQQQQIPSTTPQDWNQQESENTKRNTNLSKSSSSGSSDSGRKAFPVIQIDMKGYGY
ncbi:unnamed protein product [Meloidogyne enterolobii]|uniref:Uncharacterized protein n=1 Tax=Meloidogyne enterolobii TaxID=390850 RepID=A0ACB0XUM9_MELEN